MVEHAAAGLVRARRRRRRQRLVAAPDLDGIGRARRRAVPARCGAEPDAADLPVPRGVVHRAADRLQAADHAVDVEQVRLRRARRAGRRARSTACTRSSPITGTRTAIPRRCRPRRPAPIDRPTIRCAGSSTRRARPRSRRARGTPIGRCSPGAIGYAKKTHVVEDDIALVAFPFTHVGGIIIGVFTPLLTGSAAVLDGGVDAAGLDRADPRSTRSRSGTARPRSTPRCSPKRTRTPTPTRRSARSRRAGRPSRRSSTTTSWARCRPRSASRRATG